MTEWFDNPHFWEQLEPFLFTKVRNEEWTRKELIGIETLLGVTPPARLLDLACGPGRHALPLARKGYRVTGVDITPAYLRKIGRQAGLEKLHIDLIHENMREFVKEEFFDAAINMYSSFGYFHDQRHDFQVLDNVFQSLKPGGRFLLDLLGREVLKRVYRERESFQDIPSGSHLVQTSTVNRRWEWVENHWTVVQGQHQKDFKFGIRIYSGEEITQAFQKAGFSKVRLFGTFSGGPYDKDAERLLVVGTKPS